MRPQKAGDTETIAVLEDHGNEVRNSRVAARDSEVGSRRRLDPAGPEWDDRPSRRRLGRNPEKRRGPKGSRAPEPGHVADERDGDGAGLRDQKAFPRRAGQRLLSPLTSRVRKLCF